MIATKWAWNLRNLPPVLRDQAAFWHWVELGDECWIWHGPKTHDGYGRMHTFSFGRIRAHRIALWIATGVLPKDKYACHHCDNPICVRPDHLYWGDADTNNNDCLRRGRANLYGKRLLGSKNPKSKLTADSAREVVRRQLKGEKLATLAREFGVSRTALHAVVHGHAWAHATGVKREGARVMLAMKQQRDLLAEAQ